MSCRQFRCRSTRRFAILLFSLLIFSGLVPLSAQDFQLRLDSAAWVLRNPYDTVRLPAQVPGEVHGALLRAGLLPDPYLGTGEAYVQWVSQREWVYECRLPVRLPQAADGSALDLVLEGVDGHAGVYWNGQLIGRCDNAFRPYRFPLPPGDSGEQLLQIVFLPAEALAGRRQDDYGIRMPGGARVFSRTPAYQWGWDWAPRLISAGLSGSVRIESRRPLRIEHMVPVVDSFSDTRLWGRAQVILHADCEGQALSRISLDGQLVSTGQLSRIERGANRLWIPFSVKNPKLWWTRDMGEAYQYEALLHMEIVTDGPQTGLFTSEKSARWGLRTAEIHRAVDSLGEGFEIRLNGLPVFARGANYVPMEALSHRRSDARLRRLLGDAAAAHMNCLRVWGGGRYESERFYELCDSLGIMVWQDFMFACGMYPDSDLFVKNVREEALHQVSRLSVHPSVVLWCGNNEVAEGWARWGWQEGLPFGQRARLDSAYRRLFADLLPGVVDSLSGGLSYWESSPQYGRSDERFDRYGDAHDWGVWHDEMPFSRYEKRVPRFMSEYGFQSWPSLATASDFYRPEDGLFTPQTHQKHPRGDSIMARYRRQSFAPPEDLIDSIYTSQLVQARGMMIAAEAHRIARPYCMGSLYWQLNDCWPAISWSGIDYRGHWKALHAMIGQAFEPVLVTVKSTRDSLYVWGVNDTREPLRDSLWLRVWLHGAEPVWEARMGVSLAPGTARKLAAYSLNTLSTGQDLRTLMLSLRRDGAERSRYFLLSEPRDYEGRHHPLRLQCAEDPRDPGRMLLTARSESVHLSLYLPPELLLRQSDNFRDVAPGEPLRVPVRACPTYFRSFP